MDRTLREHIDGLEQKLRVLTTQMMEEKAGDLRAHDELVVELRAIESALTLYRSAFEVESRVLNPAKQVPPEKRGGGRVGI
jgi:hypothetical protein